MQVFKCYVAYFFFSYFFYLTSALVQKEQEAQAVYVDFKHLQVR